MSAAPTEASAPNGDLIKLPEDIADAAAERPASFNSCEQKIAAQFSLADRNQAADAWLLQTAHWTWQVKLSWQLETDLLMELRERAVTPHVAQNRNGRRSAIDGRTTRHPGYAVSQRIRKRIEEAFGWAKTVAGLRKMRHRGLPRVGWQFTLAMAAYNLVRLPKLLAAAAP